MEDLPDVKPVAGPDPKNSASPQWHFFRTVERNGRWIQECTYCGFSDDINDLTDAEMKALVAAEVPNCPSRRDVISGRDPADLLPE